MSEYRCRTCWQLSQNKDDYEKHILKHQSQCLNIKWTRELSEIQKKEDNNTLTELDKIRYNNIHRETLKQLKEESLVI